MSEGEDGRPCIKGRRKLSMKPTGEERETVEKIKEVEKEVEEKSKTENPRDAEIELLIMEYQKNAKPAPKTLKVLEFFGGEVWT